MHSSGGGRAGGSSNRAMASFADPDAEWRPRARPEPGWLACRAGTRHVINGYHEEDFEIWDSGGRLVAQARQLARLS